MGSSSFEIFELPGTRIDILDGLEACGLGVVCVSSPGSVDIPAFKKKYVLYRPYALHHARHVKANTIAVPDDAQILKAETVFGFFQLSEEEFLRESLELQIVFESERGLSGANTTLVTLGQFPKLPEGRFCPPSEGGIQ